MNATLLFKTTFVHFKYRSVLALLTVKDDLSEGRFLPSFIERAANARTRRLHGEFDKWKVVTKMSP